MWLSQLLFETIRIGTKSNMFRGSSRVMSLMKQPATWQDNPVGFWGVDNRKALNLLSSAGLFSKFRITVVVCPADGWKDRRLRVLIDLIKEHGSDLEEGASLERVECHYIVYMGNQSVSQAVGELSRNRKMNRCCCAAFQCMYHLPGAQVSLVLRSLFVWIRRGLGSSEMHFNR